MNIIKNSIRYNNYLPLSAPMTCTRKINVESCAIDDKCYQIRGELTTNRADYEDINKEINIQSIVICLTLSFKENIILNAEFAMPIPGIQDICEHLPIGPENLIGLKVEKGITKKISQLYDKTKTCWDLQTLLLAMIRLIPSISRINGDNKIMDKYLSPEDIPNIMKSIAQTHRNICHAWSDQDGSILQCIVNGDYEKILKNIGNRILMRWEIKKLKK